MEVIIDCCAGLDVHKKTVVACVRSPGAGRSKRHSEVRTFGTFEDQLVALRDWLVGLGATQVAMEATGVYWKPVWHVLDDGGLFDEVLLVNPAHIKNVPGRKTDVNDATWIAQLLECGLLRGSFVPPTEIRQLREITRYRRQLTEERSREVVPFADARDRFDTIPGIARRNAEIIVAEIGVDMSQFPTPAHLASWAGLCPGNNESAGKHKSTKTRSGNPWLTSALVEAAWSAVRTKDCYLAVRFPRIAKRRGEQRALIAIAHTILVICWHLLVDQTTYHELATDYLAGKDQPDRRRKLLVRQLEQLGYNVELTPAA